MGAGDPPSTILIDGVPVKGVKEFIYLGSKQSSKGYCRPNVLRRIGLACSVIYSLQRIWKCSSLSTNTKVHLYQALVMSVLLCGAETWTLLVADMETLEAFTWGVSDRYLIYAGRLMPPMQRCFSDLVCQPLVTYCVINAYLCGHVSRLDPGVPAHDALRLMVDTYEGRKPMASWRRPPGRLRNVWLNKVQEDTNALPLSTLCRSEIAGVMEQCNGPLGLCDDDDVIWPYWLLKSWHWCLLQYASQVRHSAIKVEKNSFTSMALPVNKKCRMLSKILKQTTQCPKHWTSLIFAICLISVYWF